MLIYKMADLDNNDEVPHANEVTDNIVDAESIDPKLTELKLTAIQNIASFFQKNVQYRNNMKEVKYTEEEENKWNKNVNEKTPWLNAIQHDLRVDIDYVVNRLNTLNADLKNANYATIPSCGNTSGTKCEWNETEWSIDQLLNLLWYVYTTRFNSEISTFGNKTNLIRWLKFHEDRFAEAADQFDKKITSTNTKKGFLFGTKTTNETIYEPFKSPENINFAYQSYKDNAVGDEMEAELSMSKNYILFKQYICHYIYNIVNQKKGGKNRTIRNNGKSKKKGKSDKKIKKRTRKQNQKQRTNKNLH